jgi:hypothetical protein
MGAVLKFPRSEKPEGGGRPLALNLRPEVQLERFDQERCVELLAVMQRVLDGSNELLEFVDSHRDAARRAGVDTIAIEISVLLESDRLERLLDALEDAALRRREVHVTLDGLSRLRRLERLLAEASSNITRFTSGGFRTAETRARREAAHARAVLDLEERRVAELREEVRAKEDLAQREIEPLGADGSRARREADHAKAVLDLEESRLAGIRRELRAKEDLARYEAEEIGRLGEIGGIQDTDFPVLSGASRGASALTDPWVPLAIFGAVAVTVVLIVVAIKA